MKEFTSTVTLQFAINNIEATDKQDYIDRLKDFILSLMVSRCKIMRSQKSRKVNQLCDSFISVT